MIKTAQKTVKVSHPPTFQLPRNPNLDPHCTGRPQARFPDKTKQADSTIDWTQIFAINPTNNKLHLNLWDTGVVNAVAWQVISLYCFK